MCSEDINMLNCPRVNLSNKLVLELNNYRIKGNFTWKESARWLYALSLSRPEIEWNETSTNTSVSRLISLKQAFLHSKQKEEASKLLSEGFSFPKLKVKIKMEMLEDEEMKLEEELEQTVVKVEVVKKRLDKADDEVFILSEKIRVGAREREAQVAEILMLRRETKRLKSERE